MNNFIQNHLEKLELNNFSYPEVELRALLNKSSKSKKEIIFSNFNINQINYYLFKKAFARRLQNEPIAKIFNQKNFWKYCFYTNKDVIDPRPETELIIETVQKYFVNYKQSLKIIDMGTGSGCLAISLAKEYINSKVTATDISQKSLKVAKRNSIKFNTFDQIKFICCDWVNTEEIFDIVVCNPPYLTQDEYNNTNKCNNNASSACC